MRLRFPIPVAVLAGAVGIGAISMAGAQGPTLQPAANPVAYSLVLNGANEVTPNVGDPDGAGQASITVDGTTGQVCVNITTTDIDTYDVDAHSHWRVDRQRTGFRRLRATERDRNRARQSA